jgi:hypothetical protein
MRGKWSALSGNEYREVVMGEDVCGEMSEVSFGRND